MVGRVVVVELLSLSGLRTNAITMAIREDDDEDERVGGLPFSALASLAGRQSRILKTTESTHRTTLGDAVGTRSDRQFGIFVAPFRSSFEQRRARVRSSDNRRIRTRIETQSAKSFFFFYFL